MHGQKNIKFLQQISMSATCFHPTDPLPHLIRPIAFFFNTQAVHSPT